MQVVMCVRGIRIFTANDHLYVSPSGGWYIVRHLERTHEDDLDVKLSYLGKHFL